MAHARTVRPNVRTGSKADSSDLTPRLSLAPSERRSTLVGVDKAEPLPQGFGHLVGGSEIMTPITSALAGDYPDEPVAVRSLNHEAFGLFLDHRLITKLSVQAVAC